MRTHPARTALWIAGLLASLLGCIAPNGQTFANASTGSDAFPGSLLGVWRGELIIRSPGSPVSGSVPMEFRVASTEDPDRWEWTLRFGTAEGVDEKAFELRVVDAATGHYVLDEEGVPELGAYYIGDTLYSMFAIGGSLFQVCYRQQGDHLMFETIAADAVEAEETEAEGDIPPIASFPVVAVQRVHLVRERADSSDAY